MPHNQDLGIPSGLPHLAITCCLPGQEAAIGGELRHEHRPLMWAAGVPPGSGVPAQLLLACPCSLPLWPLGSRSFRSSVPAATTRGHCAPRAPVAVRLEGQVQGAPRRTKHMMAARGFPKGRQPGGPKLRVWGRPSNPGPWRRQDSGISQCKSFRHR